MIVPICAFDSLLKVAGYIIFYRFTTSQDSILLDRIYDSLNLSHSLHSSVNNFAIFDLNAYHVKWLHDYNNAITRMFQLLNYLNTEY